jgi:hypothetical protein
MLAALIKLIKKTIASYVIPRALLVVAFRALDDLFAKLKNRQL